MKKILALIFITVLYSCSHKEARLEIEDEIINVPELVLGSTAIDSVKISNTGTNILHISKIFSDCTCTVLDSNEIFLDPGESRFLKFSVKAGLPGHNQQKIVLTSNSKENGSRVIVIRTKVIT
jgi:hypothetical protein